MRHCYLIGYPVGHSMSAVMHNAAFKQHGIPMEYSLKSVEPGMLQEFVQGELRSPRVRGANVTIPHKVEVMKHLDRVDEAARLIGAVNTIVNDDSQLTGYNTDGAGALKAIRQKLPDLEGKTVVILGAGGAARSIAYELSRTVSRLVILNRTAATAEKLAGRVKQTAESTVEHGGLGCLRDVIKEADALINTTSVGMHPDTGQSPVNPALLHQGLLVFDIVYNPVKTRLLRDAEKAGAETLSGVNMLVYQGAEAFRLWTGVDPPEDTMFKAVMEALGGSQI